MSDTEALLAAVLEQTAELRKLRRALAPAEGTFSLEETAEELGCSESQVYRLAAADKITRAEKAGRHSRFTVASVRAYQQTGEPANEAPRAPRRSRKRQSVADATAAIRAIKVGSGS